MKFSQTLLVGLKILLLNASLAICMELSAVNSLSAINGEFELSILCRILGLLLDLMTLRWYMRFVHLVCPS
jgi:hypothetical protein